MVRPRRQPAPEPSRAPLRPRPGPGLVPPLPHPNQASANAFLNHQVAFFNGPPTTTASRLHRTVSNSGQRRSRPYPQPIPGEPSGGRLPNASVPRLLDDAPPPRQRRSETYTQPLCSESGSGILPVVPVRGISISIVAEPYPVRAPIASFDKTYAGNYIDRRTVNCFSHGEEPCEAEYRWTPRGGKVCSRVAVFSCMFPNMYQLEIGHTPKQVRMHVIEEEVRPLLQFGKLFQDDMEAGVYGNNLVYPWLSPDVASHHNMRQPFQGIQSYVHTTIPTDFQYEDRGIAEMQSE